jgi:hypothetical protein
MKKHICTPFICLIISTAVIHAQQVPSMRSDFLTSAEENSALINAIYDRIDSLKVGNNKAHMHYLDSLQNDSLTNTLHRVGLALRMAMFEHYQTTGNLKLAQAELLEAQALIMQTANTDALAAKIHTMMAKYFVEHSMWEASSKSFEALGAIQRTLDRKTIGELESQSAEQQQQLEALNRSTAQNEAQLKRYADYMPYAIAAAGALLLALLWSIVRSTQLKKKLNETKKRMDEGILTMDETQKMSIQFKNEGAQFKQTAEAAINKMNEIEQAKVLAGRHLVAWKEESTAEFTQLKDMIEEMKNTPTVSSYMEVQNQLARLHARNKEVLGGIEIVLKK